MLQRGFCRASGETALRIILRKRGIRIQSTRRIARWQYRLIRPRVRSIAIANLWQQIGVMLQAGLPIVQVLGSLARGQTNTAICDYLLALQSQVAGGSPFSEALSQFPDYSTPLTVQMVAIGERSGTLPGVLLRMAEYTERRIAAQRNLQQSLIYPILLLVVSLVVTGLLLTIVVPRFSALYAGAHTQLPALTQWVIHTSAFLQSCIHWVCAVVLATLLLAAYGYRRLLPVRDALAMACLRLPLIGDILTQAITARCLHTLALMHQSGIPLLETLVCMRRVSGHPAFEAALARIQAAVAAGNSLSAAMREQSLFPSMALQMVAAGEMSGNLDTLCRQAADYYEKALDAQTKLLIRVVEPLMIMGIGLVVGIIVTALYLPIFQLGQVVY
jgi:type IV pilus assembly protein PilC